MYLVMVPDSGVLPHHSGKACFLATSGYHSSNVEGSSNIRGLVKMAGDTEFFCGGLHNLGTVVVIHISRHMS